jgi:hypothetical protein
MDARVISAFTRVFDALCPRMTSGVGSYVANLKCMTSPSATT